MTLSAPQSLNASFYGSLSVSKAKSPAAFAKVREARVAQTSQDKTTFKNDHPALRNESGAKDLAFKVDHRSVEPTGDPMPPGFFRDDHRRLASTDEFAVASPAKAETATAARLDASFSMKNEAISELMADRATVL